jgi:arylsulfate sulfotransferase
MIRPNRLIVAAAAFCASSLQATVGIVSLSPSVPSPQPLGTQVTWTAQATDSNASGLLTFQYSVSYAGGPFSMVRDFYPGTLAAGVWTGPAFVWHEILGEGSYRVRVVAKDFQSGETATTSAVFSLAPVSTGGTFVVSPTANPLVALGSAPPCPSGSSIRLTMQRSGGPLVSQTNLVPCNPQLTSNLFAAGMYPSTAYSINYEVVTGTTVTKGPNPVTFTTGPLPSSVTFPTFTVVTPFGSQDEQSDYTVLHSFISDVVAATDRVGNVLWYYAAPSPFPTSVITRPLPGGYMLTLQTGNSWNPNITAGTQLLREIDLSGNIIRETNIGVLQHQLMAMGATDFGPCGAIPLPAAVGSACLGTMHHDAVRMPNGYTIVNINIEKIFAPGTQGNTTGLNVDILGDGFLVLDKNFQLAWYFDTFQHDTGAPQLDINRAAVLGETCAAGQPGCPYLFLAGTTGVTTLANDWLHQNSVYFDPANGDVILSSRHQDWLYKVDYNNGTGTGNILWLMGLDGSFTFNNIDNDPYPWFSHQHDAGIDNTSTGELTVFDDGDTRVSPPPVGLGTGNSRGMSLTVDETNMTVTPLLSQDLGVYSYALGSAHALANGNYFFQPGTVTASGNSSFAVEVLPTAGTVGGTIVYNLQASNMSYRSWLMPSLYFPPAF